MEESSPTQAVDGSVHSGSEVMFDIVCFTCNSEGIIAEAVGYCSDCSEHLCTLCLKYHGRCSATKHHTLIDKENMPGKQTIYAADICTERCHNHKDEIIKYFCPTHKLLGCSACVTLKHKLCNDVTYIPDAVVDFSDSQEFKNFQSNLEQIINRSEYISKAMESNIKLSADYRAKALQKIEAYRQELNDALDKLKDEIEHQSEEIHAIDVDRMNSMADASNRELIELQRMASDIKELVDKKQHCKLFIEMKNAEDQLTAIQQRLPKEEETFVTAVKFQPNSELQTLIQRKDAFGKLLLQNPSEMKATFLADINVKCSGNTKKCYISSAALLSESRLVVTDKNNKAVKLIDIEHNKVISEYKAETPPRHVTIVDNSEVAITLPDEKKLQFLKSIEYLKPVREMTFDKPCLRVTCVDEKLIVSFIEPCEVRILNMAGEVLHTFATTSQGDRLFSKPPYLSVSSFNQAIYASDWERKRVTMLDMDGKVSAIYEDADLKNPYHTAVDDYGTVYLCDPNSDTILLLTPDCRKVKILLSDQDGIRFLQGICYCKVTQRLYVGMFKNDTINVFQLS